MARRVRWWCSSFSTVAMCLFFGVFWFRPTRADCFYDEERYGEGVEVATFENCLNCTCTRGVLLCYLRVCPKLPNPPPVGCILLHRYRTCCPELICTDLPNENTLEARSDPDGLDLLPFEGDGHSDACIANGSIYSPGSAMASSSLCEYCYCLRGRQTCVKPKCLLPIEGCVPNYDPNQCCPSQYNCTLPKVTSSTTTTMVPTIPSNIGGCLIDNEYYPEGGKVLGVGHSICDNCYCLRGMLRCEPLSCAPPLLGCTPIVKPGECCAASYNCTGSIEINPEPNYGQYPTVSKEYSKLRKEQPKHPPPTSNRRNGLNKPKDPFYVIAESAKSNTKSTSGTTRQITGTYFNPSTTTPFYYKSMLRESEYNGYKHVTRSYPESKFGTTLNHDNDKKQPTIEIRNKITTIQTEVTTLETTTNVDTTLNEIETTEPSTEEITPSEDSTTTENFASTTIDDDDSHTETITMRSVLNSTDCIDGAERRNDLSSLTTVAAEKINELSEINEFTSSVEVSSEDVSKTTDDITEVDLQSSFTLLGDVSPKVKNGSEITSLLNVSKTKENDYDFDYNEPSLPPSLPNLHIIPFLAADALDTKKDDNTIYAQDKSSNDSFEFNFFSPPVKTEGGFVPNGNPVILETLYDNAVTVPSITNSPGNVEASCLSEGQTILHGQSVASDSPCTTCTCFYGNIVCQKAPCPIPGPNCRKSVEDLTLCCPLYVCDGKEELPLEHQDTKSTTPDPFKNVIKTEPAPDLQSLIVDMLPHLTKKPVKKTTIYITTLQPEEVEKTTKGPDDGSLGLDGILALLLGGKETTPTTTTTSTTTTKSIEEFSNHLDEQSSTSGAILKLAGCNIYGRMYRVGRIISELSGPCRECKCTEVGVQCKPLKC